ncbi:hypothetical protein BH11VER1_BH11VER1_27120 [soil metagenome]
MSIWHRLNWRLPALILALVVSNTGCRKSAEKPKSAKKLYGEADAKANREQMALNKFAAALREILQWRQSQEDVQTDAQRQAMVKALAEKMIKVPKEGLAPDLMKAWESMLPSWQALAATPVPDEGLHHSGAEAARELNQLLEVHGVVDIRF